LHGNHAQIDPSCPSRLDRSIDFQEIAFISVRNLANSKLIMANGLIFSPGSPSRDGYGSIFYFSSFARILRDLG